MTDTAIIPREKACFYWNDFDPDIPRGKDVLVLSIDDPHRDRKSATYENSSGALIGDFQSFSSAEKVFREFFEQDSVLAAPTNVYASLLNEWLREFSKIEGFMDPLVNVDEEREYYAHVRIGHHGSSAADRDDLSDILAALGPETCAEIEAIRCVGAGSYEVEVSVTDRSAAEKIGREIGSYLHFKTQTGSAVRVLTPPVVVETLEF
ncbi:hypothetical protein WMC41_16055 [Shinella yambaruensis]|uniref:hypothetical protein n=1 Tax=Shinella yambaruensis TaxID=415996 RepID=UPI003D78FC67